jgi:DUF4097 and DUF4098 domain-containing protein YvlB
MRPCRFPAVWTWVILCLVATAAAAQAPPSTNSNRITVPLSNPARPANLHVSIIAGSIVVTGYDGKEVLIEPRMRDDDDEDAQQTVQEHEQERRDRDREREQERRERDREHKSKDKDKDKGNNPGDDADSNTDMEDRARGLRRVPNLSSGLSVEEDDNNVQVGGPWHNRTVDLDIKVPVNSSVHLQTVNDGDIVIRNLHGEIEAENTNGRVTLTRVTGPVVAHAMNGDVVATFVGLATDRPSSFSSMNGDIDVTLPADAKATVKIRADSGEIYTDFELKTEARTEASDDPSSRKGKRTFGYETGMYGTLNGGGATLRFQTFNGSVYIRKAK